MEVKEPFNILHQVIEHHAIQTGNQVLERIISLEVQKAF